MKNLVITNGNWTANGNFSGYDLAVGRVHLYGAQMKSIGYAKDATVVFPLFAIGSQATHDTLDTEGNPTGEKFTRWQANGLFKTSKELVAAKLASASLDVEYKKELKALGTTEGLSEVEMETLIASIG